MFVRELRRRSRAWHDRQVKPALSAYRLRAQRLVGAPEDSPADVVDHLGAVQSQLPDMALWAIGRRSGATLADVEAAFARGDFVRTHVLRPTWHDVLAADLPDLIEITAPRIRQAMASNNRRDGLTPTRLTAQADLAIEAIRSSGPLTRREVEAHLVDAGYVRQGNSMAHVMIEAELTGAIHSGPIRGKQHTYVSADLPPSRRTPDERLAWIARTYGRGHGPFRDKDLAWWATLTLTQARRAIELAELEPVELYGEVHHLAEPLDEIEVPRVLLLANFDEYISYARDPDDYALIDGDVGMFMRATGLLFIDGAVAGSWTRSLTTSEARVEVTPGSSLSRAVRSDIEAEAERFGAFVQRPVDVHIHAPTA